MRRVFGWWWRVRLVLVALFVAVGGCSGHPGAGTPDGGGQPDAAAVGDSADAGAADATGDAGAGGDLGPVDVSAADAPTADVPPADVPLADVTSGDVPLADVPLADVTSGDVPLADVPAADVPLADVSGADAAPGDGWSDTTAGDAGTLGDAMGDVGTVDVAVADATLDEVAPGDASTDATAGDAGPQEDALLDVGAVDDVVADAALDDATTTPDAVADAALDDATETADALTDATLDDAVAEVTDDVAAEVTGDVIEEVTEPPTGPAPLLITELMARNGGDGAVLDEDGDSSDWVELHNPTDEVVLLEGWHLSDDPDVLDKWTLPAVELAPGGYLVVFASGKDRAVAGEELHTNFKLSGDGEYLALVAPTLEVVHAFDAFPPQLQGLSWGVLATVQDTPLVAAGDGARFAVGSVDAGWEAPGFDDSTWTEGPTGLGFFGGDELAPLDLVADSKAGFSGVQGQAGWWYGYWNRTADLDDVYEADELTLFPSDGGGFSPTDFWTGAGWDWFQGNPPWTWIGPEGSHPNGTNNGAEHWAVRRLVSPVAGTLLAQWHVRKTNPNGSGVSARLFREGVELDAVALAGWDTTGTVRTVLLEGLEVGERVDLTLEPTGIDGETHDGSDGSATWLKLWTVADYGPWIGTDVGAEMLGQTEEAAARLRFDLPAESGFNRLVLGMRYDDGFEAWLNGAPLAASAGAGTHADDLALNREEWLLPAGLAALVLGDNVLAVRGVNAAVDDPTFLMVPELEGRVVTQQPEELRYFVVPTPGADNLVPEGTPEPPPLLDAPTVGGAGEVKFADTIPLQVTVVPTAAEIAEVTVWWRVMFGAEVALPMIPAPGAPGLWLATIPAGSALPGHLVRWRYEAVDVDGRLATLPPFQDPLDSEEYYGTVIHDASIDTALPLYQWFAEDPSAAATDAGTRAALFYGGELYDNVRFDLHGQSTKGFPKKSYNVDFNRDHRFELAPEIGRMKDINLLTNWADKTKLRNTLAYEVFRDAHAAFHLAFPVRVQLNGEFFAVYDFVEDGDDVWLERLGLDPEGALYKMYDSLVDPAASEKKTRRWEGSEDLAALIEGLVLPEPQRRAFIFDNVDLAAMVNYVAAATIAAGRDCCHKNYYLYRDTNGSGEWWFMPWDQDLTFGHDWTGNYFDDALYFDKPLLVGWNNTLLGALFAQPDFIPRVMRRLRTLMDALVQPPETPAEELHFEGRVAELQQEIGADGDADTAAWPTWGQAWTWDQAVALLVGSYLAPRRQHLYGLVGGGEVEPVGEPVVLVSGELGVTPLTWLVPVDDSLGTSWTEPGFDDSAWAPGTMGLGYENFPADYAALLDTIVVPQAVDPAATSVLARIVFEAPDPATLAGLVLRARYDDGVVAWLNGHEIARRGSTGPLAWNATLVSDHSDSQAIFYEKIDVAAALDELVEGTNVLALRVTNVSPSSSDLLLGVELVDFVASGGGDEEIPTAQGEVALSLDLSGLDLTAEGISGPEEAWVAVWNPAETEVDLSGWALTGAVNHQFRPGSVLPAGDAVYVVRNAAAFRARATSPTGGEGLWVQGDFALPVDGATAVELRDAEGQPVPWSP